MKKIMLLGASGSIGQQSIDVIFHHSDQFELVGFSVGYQIDKAIDILSRFDIKIACVIKKEDAQVLALKFPQVKIVYGDQGLIQCASYQDYDTLVNALVGFSGLHPTVYAIKNHKEIALANKETLVVGGEYISFLAKENNVSIVPIDSEHSAIFQCLLGYNKKQVKRLYITASGGAFRNLKYEQLANVTASQALQHPNWKMGDKITIDSATMVNKGFEIMEASWLFGIDIDNITPLLHPASIVHSMVEYEDGAVLAQLGSVDMRLAIQFALTYPNRYPVINSDSLDFSKAMDIHFEPMDYNRFKLLSLCIDMAKKKGLYPCVLNGANEVANLAFRENKISYYQLENIIIETCNNNPFINEKVNLQSIDKADKWAREYATSLIK